MDIAEATRLKQQAVQRVLARRRPNRGPSDSEFLPPETVSQWADDAVAILPPTGPHAALIAILEGARQSEAAAVAAVGSVAELSGLDQYAVYATLAAMPCGLPEAKRITSAVRTAWRRQGLAEAKPGVQLAAEGGPR